jgi:hypothetical protein
VRFVINGVPYDAAKIDRITGKDAIEITRQVGFGVQTMARRLAELQPEPGVDPIDPFDSEPHLRALFALVWLTMKATDPSVTFEDVIDLPLDELDLAGDDEDEPFAEVPGVDPTQPGSVPVAEVPVLDGGASSTDSTTTTSTS